MEQINPETLKQAKEELEAICTKYSIALVPVVVHQGDRTISSIEIVPVRLQAGSSEAPQAE
jgi:hypothetical protein